MQKEGHSRGEPPLPKYDASPELKKLVLMFMGAMPINFLTADSVPIGMRIIKIEIALINVYCITQNVLFFRQVMFFEEISANTLWFSDYAVSKWARRNLQKWIYRNMMNFTTRLWQKK